MINKKKAWLIRIGIGLGIVALWVVYFAIKGFDVLSKVVKDPLLWAMVFLSLVPLSIYLSKRIKP